MGDEERKLRVLLVDDEPDMLYLLQSVVSAESWEIVGRATNAPDAVRLAEKIEPDVAIVDYRMPGENGLELAGRLRSLWPEITNVVFSAMDVEREVLASGHVDRFVRKGDLKNLRTVLDQLNNAFQRRGGQSGQ